MAITITDTRAIANEADDTTGWTGNVGAGTSAPDPVESTARLGTQVSSETQDVYYTDGTPRNLTDSLFYIWGLPGGVLDTTANGGIAVILGDGTNTIAYTVGGADGSAFRHEDGPVFWQCYVIDTANPPASTRAISGSAGAINFGSITQFGISYTTLAKSVGGAENCFTDISRYGGNGLIITAGTSGDPSDFSQLALADRGIGNQQAYGVCRRLGAGLFGLQGSLTIGDSTGTSSTWFQTQSASAVFEDRGFSTTRYFFNVTGNATGATNVILGERGGVGLGSGGVNITAPTGVGGSMDASNVNIDQFSLYGCSISGFTGGVTLSSDPTNAPNHEVFSTSFNGCGQISIGLTEFKNNSIVGSTDPTALLLESTASTADLAFSSAGTGHAILIDTPGTYTFDSFTFSGYATTDGSTGNEAVYNNSGGAVTINVVGTGDTPTIRNGTGATTTVNANVSITLTGLVEGSEVRVFNAGTATEIAGQETVNAGEFQFSVGAGVTVDISILAISYQNLRIKNFSTTSDTSVPVQQQVDRQYDNPI